MSIFITKNQKYKCSYKITKYYSDGTKQRTVEYTPAFETTEEALECAKKLSEQSQTLSITSEEASKTKKSLTVSYGKSYVVEKRYLNYGSVVKYKMKFSVEVPNPKASLSKQKTFYTPWLNSEQECKEFANDIKLSYGVTPKKQ